MNTKEYVNKLVRTNGLATAKRIATKSKNACNPHVWVELPIGKVFGGDKNDRNFEGVSKREFDATYNFWVEVNGLLGKMK